MIIATLALGAFGGLVVLAGAAAAGTRLLVTAPEEKGAIQVQPASGVAEPLFVVPGDFSLLAGRR